MKNISTQSCHDKQQQQQPAIHMLKIKTHPNKEDEFSEAYPDSSSEGNDDAIQEGDPQSGKLLSCISSVKTMLIAAVFSMMTGIIIVSVIWIGTVVILANRSASRLQSAAFDGMKHAIDQRLSSLMSLADQQASVIESDAVDVSDFKAIKRLVFHSFQKAYFSMNNYLFSTWSVNSTTTSTRVNFITFAKTPTAQPGTYIARFSWEDVTPPGYVNLTLASAKTGSLLPHLLSRTDPVTPNLATILAAQSPKSGLTPSYLVNPACIPGRTCLTLITLFTPAWRNGSMVGVSRVGYFSESFLSILRPLTDNSGVTILFEKSTGSILTATDGTPTVVRESNSTINRVATLNDINHRLISPSLHRIHKVAGIDFEKFPGQFNSSGWSTLTFTLTSWDRKKILVSAALNREYGWVMMYVVPSSVFFAPAVPGLISAIVISAVIVLIACTFGIVILRIITKPLGMIVTELDLVSTMDLDSILSNISQSPYLYEMRCIHLSFIAMVRKLKLYRSFLPSHILANLDSNNVNNEMDINESTKGDNPSSHRGSVRIGASSSSSYEAVRVISKFSISLEQREVTTFMLKLHNHYQIITALGVTDFVFLHSRLSNIIIRYANRFKGELHDCKANKFTINWNTSTQVSDPAQQALLCALHLKKEIDVFSRNFFSQKEAPAPRISIAIASSPSTFVGNLGTNDRKSYSIFGSSVDICKLIEPLNDEYGTSIVSNCLHPRAITRKIDELLLDENSVSNTYTTVPVYEVIDEKKEVADEWMYEMQHQQQDNRYALYEQAYSLYENGNIGESIHTLHTYLESCVDYTDSVALALLLKLEEMQKVEKTSCIRYAKKAINRSRIQYQ